MGRCRSGGSPSLCAGCTFTTKRYGCWRRHVEAPEKSVLIVKEPCHQSREQNLPILVFKHHRK